MTFSSVIVLHVLSPPLSTTPPVSESTLPPGPYSTSPGPPLRVSFLPPQHSFLPPQSISTFLLFSTTMAAQLFYSPALLAMKREVIAVQSQQLHHFVQSELGSVISLRTVDGWRDLPRLTDPDGQANVFNDNHVVADLSCTVPGLLGVFALSDAYPPGHEAPRTSTGRVRLSAPPSPNLGYYSGYVMLVSEYTHFNRSYGHSMGVTLSGIKGKDPNIPGIAEQGVVLVGNPACTVAQALHSDSHRSSNCLLTSRVEGGLGEKLVSTKVGHGEQALPFDAVVLQARKVVRKGDELTFSYAPHWEHTSSCVMCCFAVTKEELHDNDAFQCHDFIDASPCCFSLHRQCATHQWLDYCPFCCQLSGQDDVARHPNVWLDVHTLSGERTADGSAAHGCIITTASFAAALQRATTLRWVIFQARVLSPQHKPQVLDLGSSVIASGHLQPQQDAVRGGARSRVILYDCRREDSLRRPHPPIRTDGPAPR